VPKLQPQLSEIAETGIPGLDDVLGGGLVRHRLYLVEGVPGSGKTTLATQFLLEGAACGESVLYVTLSETAEELHASAKSHGWSLENVPIHEIVPAEDVLQPGGQYTLFHPSEVEMGDVIGVFLADVDRRRPTRLVLDSLSEFRLLAGHPLRYRRNILALKKFFAARQVTVLFLDDLTAGDRDLQVQSISHGAIHLDHLSPEYGAERRRLRIVKYRGHGFRGGFHDYTIRRGGLSVFPRLVAAESRHMRVQGHVPSGVAQFDELLGGGIERGTSTLLTGAAGTGKSTIAAQFVVSAAERGQNSALFLFDETIALALTRCAGLGIDLEPHVEAGRVIMQQIDPAELSPGEFADAIRRVVEEKQAAVVVIDSLNGYLNAMPEERHLVTQLHELLTYLGQRGVATILIAAHAGILGPMQAPVDASYLADTVILLRYFEAQGEVRQAISVVKKRSGAHERTIRELRMQKGGVVIGPPLRRFRGVLTGVPVPIDEEGAKKGTPA
jgi:circadian clock protein KaiC